MKKDNKKRLFEVFEKVNKVSLKEISEGNQMFSIGSRVRVSDGSGLDSNKEGIIVSPREVKTDGSGVPINIQGAYKPVDWGKEVAVKLDDGGLITMFKNRLSRVD